MYNKTVRSWDPNLSDHLFNGNAVFPAWVDVLAGEHCEELPTLEQLLD
jgi:hypothetical protein